MTVQLVVDVLQSIAIVYIGLAVMRALRAIDNVIEAIKERDRHV